MTGLNRDWPGRAEFFRTFAGELDQQMVDQFDAAHTTPEAHVYGPLVDDWGHHIGYGCTWDAESWPCRTIRRQHRQEQPRG